MNPVRTLLLTTLITATLTPLPAVARPAAGAHSFASFGEPSKSAITQARAAASADFRSELHLWLKENMRIDVDTANSIKKFAYGKLAVRCLGAAEESLSAKGRIWTLTLSVAESDVREALSDHNSDFDAIAAARFKEARGNDLNEALPGAIGALCAAMAKIEPPNASGGVSVADIRANVQILFDKMAVSSAETVIEGRPDELPQKSPAAVFTIDGNPLTDFCLTATVQSGRVMAQLKTDAKGALPLSGYKVPFVHNASMLNVTPDARQYIKATEFIRYRDLGIRFNEGQDLSYIYKVPALTYTLEYKASSLSKSIAIPPDFLADAHVRKYLKEHCGLLPANRGAADLTVKITVEFSQNTHNDTEEDGYEMRAVAEFRGAGVNRNGKTQYEKRLNLGLSLQPGEFFWEASGALRKLIGDTLGQ
jgi:hypothetical protein